MTRINIHVITDYLFVNFIIILHVELLQIIWPLFCFCLLHIICNYIDIIIFFTLRPERFLVPEALWLNLSHIERLHPIILLRKQSMYK